MKKEIDPKTTKRAAAFELLDDLADAYGDADQNF